MNKSLLYELQIDESGSLTDIREALEEKQFEYLERLETVNDDARRESITILLKEIETELSDINDQINSLKSAIIFDEEPEEETEFLQRTDEAPAKSSKKEEISSKIEEMKKREAEKQAKEAERLQREAAQSLPEPFDPANPPVDLDPDFDDNDDSQPTLSEENDAKIAQEISPEMLLGLTDYRSGNYDEAFETFRKLAEAKDRLAQFMLSNMYNRGEGTSKNEERAAFG